MAAAVAATGIGVLGPPACERPTEPPSEPVEAGQEPPLLDVAPPPRLVVLPWRDATEWRQGGAYAAAFTWLTELAAADTTGLETPPLFGSPWVPVPRPNTRGTSVPPRSRRAPARSGASSLEPWPAVERGPWTAAELAGTPLAADHLLTGDVRRDRETLTLTVWRCPRREPAGCGRWVARAPEKDPYPVLRTLLATALADAGGVLPEASRRAWQLPVSRDPYAFLWLGRAAGAWLAGRDPSEATVRAIRIDPRMAEAWLLWSRWQQGSPDQTHADPVNALARAEFLKPGRAVALSETARLQEARGNRERAAEALDALAAVRPRDLVLAQRRVALLLAVRGALPATRALDGLPRDLQETVPIARLRAEIAARLEQYDVVERWLARVAESSSGDERARLQLGALARRRGDRRSAERWYREAAERGGGAAARVALIQLLAGSGRTAEALEQAVALAAEPGQAAESGRWRAWLLSLKGEDGAAAAWREVLEVEPKDGMAALGRCLALSQAAAAAPAEAASACRGATMASPADGRGWLGLAWAERHGGDQEAARTHAERAVVLDPDLAEGWDLLASLAPDATSAALAQARGRVVRDGHRIEAARGAAPQANGPASP